MIVFLWMLLAVAVQKPMTEPQPGMWAAGAAYLWPGPTTIADYPAGGVAIDVPSPDGSMVLALRDTTLRVDRTGGTRTSIEVPLPVDAPAEVLWAPDSRAFTLTWTDGGWVGTWRVALYRVADASVELVDVAGEAFKAFSQRSVAHRRDCDVEAPNMGVAAWLNGGHHLLVLAEVPPHGSACDMGRIHGYTVDAATGKIMAQYTGADLRRLFLKRLGTRFH